MQHSTTCTENMHQFEKLTSEYKQKYPNHCTHCDGWGGKTSTYDPSPAGVSLGSGWMTEFEPCEHCICNNKCPRCNSTLQPNTSPCDPADLEYSEVSPCPHCGWFWNEIGVPPSPECLCDWKKEIGNGH